MRENEALRLALGAAVKRVSQLEGEQEHFLSEGMFDLVNSLCASGCTKQPLADAADGAFKFPLLAEQMGQTMSISTSVSEADKLEASSMTSCAASPDMAPLTAVGTMEDASAPLSHILQKSD